MHTISLALATTCSLLSASPPVELWWIGHRLASSQHIFAFVEYRRVERSWQVRSSKDGREFRDVALFSGWALGETSGSGASALAPLLSSEVQRQSARAVVNKLQRILRELAVGHEDLRFLVVPKRFLELASFRGAVLSDTPFASDEEWIVYLDLIKRRKSYLVIDVPGSPLRFVESSLAPPPVTHCGSG